MLIGELADRTGLSTRALRHYEDRGVLVPARDSHGYRVYVQGDIARVAQIKTMIAAGLGTDAIRAYIDCVRTSGDTHSLVMCPALRADLDQLADRLDIRHAELGRTRQRLRELTGGD